MNLKTTIIFISLAVLIFSAYIRIFVPTPSEKFCMEHDGKFKTEFNIPFNRWNHSIHTIDSCEIGGIKYEIWNPKGYIEFLSISKEKLDLIKEYDERNR